VIGLGGLGGAVIEILARLGVGRLTLVDGDRFEDSNLNRQVLSSVATLGQPKAEAARERVERINPSVEVTARTCFLAPDNATDLLGRCGVAVDCLDNLPARFMLEDACRSAGVPLVSAAVAGASGHVTTLFPADPGLRLIYGDPQQAPPKGAETALGTLPHCVVFMASLQCAEVVKILLNRGKPLRNRLLLADLTDGVMEAVNLR
jgi:molybdopterin/thiamine biosynthesis adenylyltransferase